MPAVPAPAKVLVTGGSGFLGAHVVRELLEHGYEVITTVRSSAKGDYLKTQFENFTGKISYVIVEDIEKPGAFDEAVKGVDAVEHTASPFHMKADDPQDVIGPAVQGTTGILKSIAQFAPTVKRVVITSSVAAVTEPRDSKTIFTEADWNMDSVNLVNKLGKEATQADKYKASKTLAEQSAWKFVEENKGKINFDITTLQPPWIFGPTIHEIKNIEGLNESIDQFYKVLLDVPPKERAVAYYGNFIDVREVATAHVRALEVEEAGGNRFIVSNGPFSWQNFLNSLRKQGIPNVPEGHGDVDTTTMHVADGAKAAKTFGIKYRGIDDTTKSTLESIRARFPEAK